MRIFRSAAERGARDAQQLRRLDWLSPVSRTPAPPARAHAGMIQFGSRLATGTVAAPAGGRRSWRRPPAPGRRSCAAPLPLISRRSRPAESPRPWTHLRAADGVLHSARCRASDIFERLRRWGDGFRRGAAAPARISSGNITSTECPLPVAQRRNVIAHHVQP